MKKLDWQKNIKFAVTIFRAIDRLQGVVVVKRWVAESRCHLAISLLCIAIVTSIGFDVFLGHVERVAKEHLILQRDFHLGRFSSVQIERTQDLIRSCLDEVEQRRDSRRSASKSLRCKDIGKEFAQVCAVCLGDRVNALVRDHDVAGMLVELRHQARVLAMNQSPSGATPWELEVALRLDALWFKWLLILLLTSPVFGAYVYLRVIPRVRAKSGHLDSDSLLL